MTSIKRLAKAEDVHAVLTQARSESERQLELMRAVAKDVLGNDMSLIVGVNGSVARREVTSGSDVDLFVLTQNTDVAAARVAQSALRDRLKAEGIKMPSHGGVFEEPLTVDDLASNIGGDADTNAFLTRRMLYLLEGEWLHNPQGFADLRTRLIAHYVTEDLEDRKLCRYLLNDVIRYWRTICVDFEEKTADGGKPRAIRLIKLRFARMMLYFGGVAAISQTGDLPAAAKREKLFDMFAKPPIDRLIEVFDENEIQVALTAYASFLHSVDDMSIRAKLDQDGFEGLKTDEYVELVEVAREFRESLQNLLVGSEGLRNRVASALLL